MSTGIILGTGIDRPMVCAIVVTKDFVEADLPFKFKHNSISDLVIQVQKTDTIKMHGINTLIEYEDYSNRWPNNPGMRVFLSELYGEIPDLVYVEYDDYVRNNPFKPLSMSGYL